MSWIVDGRPETVRRQVHEALADMGTETSELTCLRLVGDTLGAYQDVPLEESLGALIELRDQGLIRRIGLSGASPRILARARRMTSIAAVRNRFNLLDRSGVQVLADCEAQGILFIPYFPLAAGRLSDYHELTGPAERLGATPAQIALAWLLRRSPAMVVIPGASSTDHLRSNVAASEVAGRLTGTEVARLTELVDESKAVLDRPTSPARSHAEQGPRGGGRGPGAFMCRLAGIPQGPHGGGPFTPGPWTRSVPARPAALPEMRPYARNPRADRQPARGRHLLRRGTHRTRPQGPALGSRPGRTEPRGPDGTEPDRRSRDTQQLP
ncbi:aldo/keto reductase [Streptomyces malaysiensis]|uniref:aldo/keto reductase n=1 Tax=Streptomyces malaysiensis TaxID=92644 RepID=UPI00202F0B95|nr:aldo/keto reductase [Streptomyces malaysiensis]